MPENIRSHSIGDKEELSGGGDGGSLSDTDDSSDLGSVDSDGAQTPQQEESSAEVPMKGLLAALNPFSNFSQLSWPWKLWAVINAPITLAFNITIPVWKRLVGGSRGNLDGNQSLICLSNRWLTRRNPVWAGANL